jgi:cytochrome c oxidase assembly factor CtaG
MVIAVGFFSATVCYWLGGRRPVRVVPPSSRRWGARQWHATAFFSGVALALVLLSNGLDAVARAHIWLGTIQLVVLVMLVAPLLVLGAPWPRFAYLLGRARAGLAASRRLSLLAFAAFNGMLFALYLPPVVAAIGKPGWLREVVQLAVVVVAVFFWSQVIAQPPRRCALNHVERVAYLVLSSVLIRVLGLILGFASASFYGVPLIEQQFAAGILLVPGVLTDLIVLTVCLYLWLGQDERKTAHRFDSGGRSLPVATQLRPMTSATSQAR